jgi:hypothetical protein
MIDRRSMHSTFVGTSVRNPNRPIGPWKAWNLRTSQAVTSSRFVTRGIRRHPRAARNGARCSDVGVEIAHDLNPLHLTLSRHPSCSPHRDDGAGGQERQWRRVSPASCRGAGPRPPNRAAKSAHRAGSRCAERFEQREIVSFDRSAAVGQPEHGDTGEGRPKLCDGDILRQVRCLLPPPPAQRGESVLASAGARVRVRRHRRRVRHGGAPVG